MAEFDFERGELKEKKKQKLVSNNAMVEAADRLKNNLSTVSK